MPESLSLPRFRPVPRRHLRVRSAPSQAARGREGLLQLLVQLEEVRSHEGLASVGANAFTGTRLRELRLPSSVEELGTPCSRNRAHWHAGAAATFSIVVGSCLSSTRREVCTAADGREGV